MTGTIFNQESKEATPPTNGNASFTASPDDLLAKFVNDKGEQKYKSVEDAFKALEHSQQFIEQLKTEKTAMAMQLEKSQASLSEVDTLKKTVEELLNKQPSATLDESRLQELVNQTLTQRSVQEKRAANLSQVTNTLVKKFGSENAETVFYSRAAELGFSRDQINSLAADSPAAVFKLFDINENQSKQRLPSYESKVRTEAFQQTNEQSYIGLEKERLKIGATEEDYRNHMERAKRMTEELEAAGYTPYDLSDPKIARQFNIKF